MSRFVLLIVVPLFLALPVSAQVVRDGSMGPPALDPSVDPDLGLAVDPGVDPNGASADYLISADLGETSGSSLFHSFDQFSVSEGQVATFTGPATIDLIVSRTTGTEGSFLFGTLRSTIPNAELFFLSPGGLVIGEGAQLDVPGSVHFSTASVVRFGADPLDDLPTGTLARPTLLSSAPPSAFGFGPDPAPISVGVVDSVDHSKTLSVPRRRDALVRRRGCDPHRSSERRSLLLPGQRDRRARRHRRAREHRRRSRHPARAGRRADSTGPHPTSA